MTMRTRTRRRLLLLGGAATVLAVGAFLFFVVRNWQRDRTSAEYRVTGLAAEQAGDWYKALNDTGAYIKRRGAEGERDAEVVLAYGRSRRMIEEPDGSHIRDAIKWYQRYVDLRPDDRAVRRELLDIMMLAGFFPEARDLAASLRPSTLEQCTLEDLPVLREELKALYASKSGTERIRQVFDRIIQLDPLDIDAHIVRLDQLFTSGDRAGAASHAAKLYAAHKADPRANLIAALGRIQSASPDDLAVAQDLLSVASGTDSAGNRAAQIPIQNVEHARRIVEALDTVGMFRSAMTVLEDATKTHPDLRLERSLVRRLWQDGNHAAVLARTASLNPEDRKADGELLGLRAMSLIANNDIAGADKIAKALSARSGDLRGSALAVAIAHTRREGATPALDAIDPLRAAIKQNPNEPILHFTLGEVLASLGRSEEARAAWKGASEARDPLSGIVARGWSIPYLRTAETLNDEGRAVDAARAASIALAMDPAKLANNIVFFEAQTSRLLVNSEEGPKPVLLLERLSMVEQGVTGLEPKVAALFKERLVPCRIVFLARAGRTEDAKRAATQAIANPDQLSASTLRRIAAISAVEGLGVEQAAMEATESKFGQTAEVIFARAMDEAIAGRPEVGEKLLREAADANPKQSSFSIALARYLEARDRAGAAKVWSSILERFPDDVFAVRSALNSPVIAIDRELVERTIARYQTLTGKDSSEDVLVKVARARVVLAGEPSRSEIERAQAMLAEVVQSNPSLVEPRLALAATFTISDPAKGIEPDYQRAILQLTAALASDPRSADILLELGRLEQLRGDIAKAREHLTKVADDRQSDWQVRRRAAELLIAQGDIAPVALRTLEDISTILGERTPQTLSALLGECYRIEKQDAKALAIFQKLETSASELDSLYMTARFFAARNETARVDAILARIQKVDARPWVIPLARARLLSDRGDSERATAAFEDALKLGPSAVEVWRAYADHLSRRGELTRAIEVADKGLAAVGNDAPLVVIREQAKMMLSPEADSDLGPMITALDRAGPQTETLAILRAIQRARVQGTLNTPEQLRQLVDQFPASIPLMMFVARKLEPIDPDQAVTMATRAVNTAQTDPEPARLLAELHLRLQRWPEMLRAAEQWRQRERSLSPEPDLAIAEALVNMNQPARGLDILKPRVEQARETPREPISLGVLTTYARLLIAANREEEARALLRPLLPTSPAVRVLVWTNVACRYIPSVDLARRWLDEVIAASPADQVEERIQIAQGMLALAARFPDRAESIAADATKLVERLAADPATTTPSVHEAIGILRHRENKLDEADRAYAKAIELDPRRTVSLNNRADILINRGKLEEGLALARKASELEPGNPRFLDTVGTGLSKLAEQREAAGSFEEAKRLYQSAADVFRRVALIIPADHAPLTRYAYYSDRAGDDKAAEWAYERLLSMRSYPAAYGAKTRNNLALVLLRLNRGGNDASRAVQLATDAVRAENNVAFRDTLGWAQLAAGNRAAALATFKELSAAPELAAPENATVRDAARIGLARALVGGSEQEREQASAILAEYDARKLAPDLDAKLRVLREQLKR